STLRSPGWRVGCPRHSSSWTSLSSASARVRVGLGYRMSRRLATILLITSCAPGVVGAAAETPSPKDSGSTAPVTEQGHVQIGDIHHWIQLRGQPRQHPVAFWLSGDPRFSPLPSPPAYSGSAEP